MLNTPSGEQRHAWAVWLAWSIWAGIVLVMAIAAWLVYLSRGYGETPGLMPPFERLSFSPATSPSRPSER